MPAVGKIAIFDANAISSTMPSQKSGMAYSVLQTAVDTRSNGLPRCQAPRMPIHTPMIVDSTVEVPTSRIVGHSREPISVETGSWFRNDRPRFPCRVCTR